MAAGGFLHAVHDSQAQSLIVDAFGQDDIDLVAVKGQEARVELIGQGFLIAMTAPDIHIFMRERGPYFFADQKADGFAFALGLVV